MTIAPTTKFKQYQNGQHRLFHGDALHILSSEILSASVDLLFLDPPYNIGKRFADFHDKWLTEADYLNWVYQLLDECVRVLKPHGTLYLMASTQSMPYFDLYLRQKLVILSRIVWHYDSSGVQAKKHFGSMYEPILHCVKDRNHYVFNASSIQVEAKTGAQRKLIDYRKTVPTVYNATKVPGNVWSFPRVRYRMKEYEDHPSQKPEALLERMILASSHQGDVLLDPFAGTHTAGAVAKRLGRASISIETQEAYLNIGLRRVLEWEVANKEKLLLP